MDRTCRGALDQALALTEQARIDALWQFVQSTPGSPLLEDAYLALLDGGATASVVCDDAAQKVGPRMQVGGRLFDRCQAIP